jgi:hypothetical protein
LENLSVEGAGNGRLRSGKIYPRIGTVSGLVTKAMNLWGLLTFWLCGWQLFPEDTLCFGELLGLISGFGGLVVSMLASGTQDRGFTEAVGFFGRKNPQHAFLRKGNKAVCPMSQICGMSKNPIIYRGNRKL